MKAVYDFIETDDPLAPAVKTAVQVIEDILDKQGCVYCKAYDVCVIWC